MYKNIFKIINKSIIILIISIITIFNVVFANEVKKNMLYDYEDTILDNLYNKWKEKEISNPEMYGTKKISDFEYAKFGLQPGNTLDIAIKNNFKEATGKYYNQYSDIILDMKRGIIDATGTEISAYNDMFKQDKNVKIINKSILDEWIAFPVSKKFALYENGLILKQFNDFIDESKNNGLIEKLDEKWFYDLDKEKDYENITVENPVREINVAAGIYMPYVYINDGSYLGFDIELFEAFCKKYNYKPIYEVSDMVPALAGLESGKYDISVGGYAITEERKQSMDFTVPYHKDEMAVIYYEESNRLSFFEKLKNSFYKTFIKENRYKLFIQGLINTLLITIFSVILGTILGLILYLLYRKGNIFVEKILGIYIYVINGLPFLVLILILYYVIFGDSSISAVAVAIISFVIVFSIFVYELFVSTISTIDNGQKEASYALGFTDNETFWKILMPQSIIRMFPSYRGQIVSLLKDTSIVGYITVFDLTRAGDIVRSRTYEALFPILCIAIIYFILGIIFTMILKYIEYMLNPYKRKKEAIERKLANG